MVRIPTVRQPTHSGEMLREEFLKQMDMSKRKLAQGIHVPCQRVNEIVNSRRGITPSTPLRLARFLETVLVFWMNLQLRWDPYHANKAEAGELERIE